MGVTHRADTGTLALLLTVLAGTVGWGGVLSLSDKRESAAQTHPPHPPHSARSADPAAGLLCFQNLQLYGE